MIGSTRNKKRPNRFTRMYKADKKLSTRPGISAERGSDCFLDSAEQWNPKRKVLWWKARTTPIPSDTPLAYFEVAFRLDFLDHDLQLLGYRLHLLLHGLVVCLCDRELLDVVELAYQIGRQLSDLLLCAGRAGTAGKECAWWIVQLYIPSSDRRPTHCKHGLGIGNFDRPLPTVSQAATRSRLHCRTAPTIPGII